MLNSQSGNSFKIACFGLCFWFCSIVIVSLITIRSSKVDVANALSLATQVTPTSEQTNTSRALYGQLISQQCDRACWRGIEPDVTNLDMLKAIWKWEGISPQIAITAGGDENNAVYTWTLNEQSPLIEGDEASRIIMITVQHSKVVQAYIPLRFCISEAIREYGIPDAVEIWDYGFDLLYSGQGMVFHTYRDMSENYTVGVFLLSELNAQHFLDLSTSLTWDEASLQFSHECEENIGSAPAP